MAVVLDPLRSVRNQYGDALRMRTALYYTLSMCAKEERLEEVLEHQTDHISDCEYFAGQLGEPSNAAQ